MTIYLKGKGNRKEEIGNRIHRKSAGFTVKESDCYANTFLKFRVIEIFLRGVECGLRCHIFFVALRIIRNICFFIPFFA